MAAIHESLAVHWRCFGHLSRETETELETAGGGEWGTIEELPPGLKLNLSQRRSAACRVPGFASTD